MPGKDFFEFRFRRKTVYRICAVSAALFFTLVTGEITIRVLYGMGYFAAGSAAPGIDTRPAYEEAGEFYGKHPVTSKVEYNTYLEYFPVPGSQGNGYSINSAGFRNTNEITPQKDTNEFRICITGGSFAWGAGVKQETVFSSRLEKTVQAKFNGRKITVINAAVGGYKSVQERIVIENILISYSPDLIIMCTGWNDAYEGYCGRDILKESTHLNYKEIIEGRKDRRYLHPPDWADYTIKINFLFDRAVHNIRYPGFNSLQYDYSKHSIPAGEAADKLMRNIGIISDLSKRYRFRLAVVLQPSLHTTSKPLTAMETTIAQHAEKMYAGFPRYSRDVYAQFRNKLPGHAQHNGYIFCDGDSAISRESKTIFADQVHTGDRGHRLFAEWLAPLVVENLPGE